MNLASIMKLDLYGLLDKTNEWLVELAEKVHIKSMLLFITMAVCAGLIGLAGYHLIKVISTLSVTGIGYIVGMELFNVMKADLSWFSKVPNWVGYLFGVILAAGFLIIGWRRSLHVLFAMFALFGYQLVYQYVFANALLALGGGLLVALLATFLLRLMVILMTSYAGGVLLISALSGIWPNLNFINLGGSRVAIWLAVALAVFFGIIQWITTRRYADA